MSWPIVKLGDVCDEVVEERVATNLLSPKTYVSTDNLIKNFGGVREADKVPQTGSAVCFREGDILLSNIRPYLRKLWIATFAGGCSNDVIVFRPKGAYERYIFHVLSQDAFFNYVMQNPSGTKMPRGRRPWIKQFSLPLPSLPEQYDIVEELEWKLARLEKIEGDFRALAETAAQASRSVLDETFRSLGAPIVKLGEVCETTSGGTPLKNVADYYDGGNIPWLRSGEVCQKDITKAKAFITTKGVEHSSAKWLPSDTVLVAMYGATAGQVGILRFPSTTNQAICGILPSKRFVPEFLYYAILAKKEFLISQAVGGAQPNISQQKIKALLLPLPSLWDQHQIVEELEWKLSRLEKVERLAREGLTVCEQARRAILTEAFRQADGADVRQGCSAAGQAEPSAQ